MSMTTNAVGTSAPTPKTSLRDTIQRIDIPAIKPSAAVRMTQMISLPNSEKTKLNEALASMDKSLAEAILKPAADKKVAAEQELATLEDDMTLTQSEKAERSEYLRTKINNQAREIQSYIGTPAYDYYMLSLSDQNN